MDKKKLYFMNLIKVFFTKIRWSLGIEIKCGHLFLLSINVLTLTSDILWGKKYINKIIEVQMKNL